MQGKASAEKMSKIILQRKTAEELKQNMKGDVKKTNNGFAEIEQILEYKIVTPNNTCEEVVQNIDNSETQNEMFEDKR